MYPCPIKMLRSTVAQLGFCISRLQTTRTSYFLHSLHLKLTISKVFPFYTFLEALLIDTTYQVLA